MANGLQPLESPWHRRPMATVARATMVVIVLWALANVVWLGRVIFFVAFFAGLVAAFLSMPVGLLERLRLPRVVATLVSVLLLLGAFAGMSALAWPTLQAQFAIVQQQLPEAIGQVIEWFQRQFAALAGEMNGPEEAALDELRDQVIEGAGTIVAGALPVLNTVFGAIAGALVAVFAGLYLTLETRLFAEQAVRLVPPRSRVRVQDTLHEVGGTLRRWMLGTFINMIAVGVMTTVVLWILGIPAPFALGLIAGVFEFVPIAGPILAAIPAVLIALIVAPERVIWVLLAYVVIQQIESNVLTPIVFKGVSKLPPALTILFQALMALLFGFLGLFLAVPLLATLMVVVRRLYVEPMESAR
jgi:predicted PurR-regulated permease PerM